MLARLAYYDFTLPDQKGGSDSFRPGIGQGQAVVKVLHVVFPQKSL